MLNNISGLFCGKQQTDMRKKEKIRELLKIVMLRNA